MAMIEGGAFKCSRHNFETESIEAWNDHCDDGDHFEAGSVQCSKCRTVFQFDGLPFHRLDAGGSKNISLMCEDCESKTKGSVKRRAVE